MRLENNGKKRGNRFGFLHRRGGLQPVGNFVARQHPLDDDAGRRHLLCGNPPVQYLCTYLIHLEKMFSGFRADYDCRIVHRYRCQSVDALERMGLQRPMDEFSGAGVPAIFFFLVCSDLSASFSQQPDQPFFPGPFPAQRSRLKPTKKEKPWGFPMAFGFS